MTKSDRTEVREMIESILKGWHSDTVLREVTTNKALANIDKHLETLNGKVASHEKTINQNLPHGINNCVQTPTIQQIRDNMVTSRAIRNAIYVAIGSTGTIFGILFILYKVFIEKAPL